MKTQDRNNFQWRPNDNSSQTRIRYDLEMNHWLKSLQSSSMKSTTSIGEVSMIVGLIISLFLNIIFFVLIIISDILVWVRNQFPERVIKRKRLPTDPIRNDKKLMEMWNDSIGKENSS